jgi:hypothetical protein
VWGVNFFNFLEIYFKLYYNARIKIFSVLYFHFFPVLNKLLFFFPPPPVI